MKSRRQARIVALQALYEIDCANHSPGVVLEHRLQETRLPLAAAEFARQLVSGVVKYRAILDRFIQEHAPEWPVEQMAHIDRNILRIALYEFAVDGRTPVKVAIDEAIEIAKLFGSDSAPRFVNGVLGTLVQRKKEIERAVADAAMGKVT